MGLILGGDKPPIPPHKLQPPPSGHKLDQVDLLLDRLFGKKKGGTATAFSAEKQKPSLLSVSSSESMDSSSSSAELDRAVPSTAYRKAVNQFQSDKDLVLEALRQTQIRDLGRMEQFRRSTGTKMSHFDASMQTVREDLVHLRTTVQELTEANAVLRAANASLRTSSFLYGAFGGAVGAVGALGLVIAAISHMTGIPINAFLQGIAHSARLYADGANLPPTAISSLPPQTTPQSVPQAARYLFLAILDYFRNLARPL